MGLIKSHELIKAENFSQLELEMRQNKQLGRSEAQGESNPLRGPRGMHENRDTGNFSEQRLSLADSKERVILQPQ